MELERDLVRGNVGGRETDVGGQGRMWDPVPQSKRGAAGWNRTSMFDGFGTHQSVEICPLRGILSWERGALEILLLVYRVAMSCPTRTQKSDQK